MSTNKEDSQWHLSKSVPISIIIGFIMQFIGVIIVAAELHYQVRDNSAAIVQIENKMSGVQVEVNQQAIQLGRIEVSVKATQHSIERIERFLDVRSYAN